MKKILMLGKIMLLIALFTLASCSNNKVYPDINAMVDAVAPGTSAISAGQLMQKIDSGEMIMLIDVRESTEFNAGYIPGALNIPRGVLEFKIGSDAFWEAAMLYKPFKEDQIIVYCKKGKRSILAAESLQKLGYSNVRYLIGGWKKWELTYPSQYEKNLDQNPHNAEADVGGC